MLGVLGVLGGQLTLCCTVMFALACGMCHPTNEYCSAGFAPCGVHLVDIPVSAQGFSVPNISLNVYLPV